VDSPARPRRAASDKRFASSLQHILMIAPEPFFEPWARRSESTGFAPDQLGHTVDLVTYPIGRNVELPACGSTGACGAVRVGDRRRPVVEESAAGCSGGLTATRLR
jgi:hypothetical protein